jgi:hypothetical protein
MANDESLSKLEETLLKYQEEQNWGLYRNTLFEIGELFKKEGKRFQALWKYFEVCYLDLNGPKNYGILPEDLVKEYPPFEPSDEGLASGLLDRVESLIQEMRLTRHDAKALFDEVTLKLGSSLALPLSPEAAWTKIEVEIVWDPRD